MPSNFETPILFLIFNRPDTTQEVFNQIKLIKPKYLFVAADGARENKKGEIEKCVETRDIIKQIDWDCEVKTLFREVNLGCGLAVSSAITWFFKQVEYGIILEDDCMPCESFFLYCEELLIKYKDDSQVMMVGGTNFQNGNKIGDESYYFSRYPEVWGWASWSRAWKYYDYDLNELEDFSKKQLKNIFNDNHEREYWRNILTKVKKGEINTWDYQWYYSIWNNNGITITSNSNLVINLGFRNSSTHDFLRDSYRENDSYSKIALPLSHPPKIINEKADRNTYKNVYGRSLKRIFRIYRENTLNELFKYIKKRFRIFFN